MGISWSPQSCGTCPVGLERPWSVLQGLLKTPHVLMQWDLHHPHLHRKGLAVTLKFSFWGLEGYPEWDSPTCDRSISSKNTHTTSTGDPWTSAALSTVVMCQVQTTVSQNHGASHNSSWFSVHFHHVHRRSTLCDEDIIVNYTGHNWFNP